MSSLLGLVEPLFNHGENGIVPSIALFMILVEWLDVIVQPARSEPKSWPKSL